MFRVKICGITTIEDALASSQAGADAIGLNFYASSPRFCPVEQARKIAAAMPRDVCRVGVFVNASANEIRATYRQVGLDLVQLHGDEPPDFLQLLRGLPVMRALRIQDDLAGAADYLASCHKLSCLPRMTLVDAHRMGQYGGTGATLDWEVLRKNRARLGGMPLVLAGGLTPRNVADAIGVVRPWAVDTASGVEERPGKKSTVLISEFVARAKAALDQAAVIKRN